MFKSEIRDYIYRVPLWAPSAHDSRRIGSLQASGIRLLDVHESAAGKLAPLLARNAGRDLYDVHQMLTRCALDRDRLRVAFVVYGAINRRDWRTTSVHDVGATPAEGGRQLIPTLRRQALPGTEPVDLWVNRLVADCRERLAAVLPLR